MKKVTVLFLVFVVSCSVMNKEKTVTLSTLDEQKLIITKEDSLIIEKENLRLKKISDSCEKYNLNCFIDPKSSNAEFYRGPEKFRKQFYQNLNIPKNSKPSKNKITLVIGKNDNIKKVEVTHYKDEFIKDEILRVLSLPEMNKWKSAKTQVGKAEYEIIFYLNIDKKK